MKGRDDSKPTRAVTPSWRALATPWLDLTQPGAAAERLCGASPRAFWCCFVVHTLALALLVTLLVLWDGTITVSRRAPMPPASVPASGPALRPGIPGPKLHERSLADVWRDQHANVVVGPTEGLFILVLILTTTCCVALAWVNLVVIHRAGAVLESFRRAFRGTVASLGLGILLVGTIGWALVAGDRWVAIRRSGARATPNLFFDLEALAAVLVPAAACLMLWWIGRAVRGLRVPAPELSPVCEGCGYDLTHEPAAGRCTECGLSVTASLSGERRPGSAWERRASPAHWLTTTLRATFRPRAFYAALKLKTPARLARRFALWHYVLLGLGGAGWIVLVYLVGAARARLKEPPSEVFAYSFVFLFATPIVCWVGHRAIAAAMFTWWLARNELRDFGWAGKVVAYESAYLWVFCLFWGTLLGSLIAIDQDWFVDLVSQRLRIVLGIRVEIFTLFVGTLLLGAAWTWRYVLAGRAIRWSNF